MLLPISPQTQNIILEALEFSINSSDQSHTFALIHALMETLKQQNIQLADSLKEYGIQVPVVTFHTYPAAIQKRTQRLAQLIRNPDQFDIHKADQIHLKKHIEKFAIEKILRLLTASLPATHPTSCFQSQSLPDFSASPPTAIEACAQQTQTTHLGKRTLDTSSSPPVSKSRKISLRQRKLDQDALITDRFVRTIDNLKNLQSLILAGKISQADADALTDDQKIELGLIRDLILQDKISITQGLDINKDSISKLVILKSLILCGQLSVEDVCLMSPLQVQITKRRG